MQKGHQHRIRVRYGETDQMGFVYHANYLIYMDEARTQLIEELGFPYAELERGGLGLAVRSADVRYRKPILYGDGVALVTHVERVRGASIRFGYEFVRTDGLLYATAATDLACLDLESKSPEPLPEELREALGHLAREQT